jgi:hypothetical protein
MAHAGQQFDNLVKIVERVRFPVWQLVPPLIVGLLAVVALAATNWTVSGAFAVLLGGGALGLMVTARFWRTLGKLGYVPLTLRGRIRAAFGRLSHDVETLFDDSDDHSNSTLSSLRTARPSVGHAGGRPRGRAHPSPGRRCRSGEKSRWPAPCGWHRRRAHAGLGVAQRRRSAPAECAEADRPRATPPGSASRT